MLEQTVKVLGLGLDRFLWNRLTTQLRASLQENDINLDPMLFPYQWKNFKEQSIKQMIAFQPDFIFTSVGLFKNLEDLEAFFQAYQAPEQQMMPSIYLLEKKPELFIKNYLRIHPFEELEFRQFPKLKVKDWKFFNFDNPDLPPFEIKPAPSLSVVKPQDLYLDKNKTVGFTTWKELLSVQWNGKQYGPREFRSLFEQQIDKTEHFKHYKGILLQGDKAYFSPGLNYRDIVRFKTDSSPIDHLINHKWINRHHTDFQSLILKFGEQSKNRCSIQFGDLISTNPEMVKSNTPIAVTANHSLLCKLFVQILKAEGFLLATSADQSQDIANQFLISLTTSPEAATPNSYAVDIGEMDIGLHFSDISQDLENDLSTLIDELQDHNKLKKQKKQHQSQVEKLQARRKALTNAKAKDDQKRYMDMVSKTKLDIFKNLIEISELWEEHNCDVAVVSDEPTLVIYDDDHQIQSISQQMGEKTDWETFDASSEATTLDSLLTFNTECLEFFLHDGIVICSLTARTQLLRRFQEFEKELANREYPPLADAIQNLDQDIAACLARLDRVTLLEYCAQLKLHYDRDSDDLLQSVRTFYRHRESRRYTSESIHKVCILSKDQQSCEQIKQALKLNSVDKELLIDQIEMDFSIDPALPISLEEETQIEEDQATQQAAYIEKLVHYNAQRLSQAFRSVFQKLKLKDYDMFLLEGDLELLSTLTDILKQKNSKYRSTATILLATGKYNIEKMKELSLSGVKVLFYDRYRSENTELLSSTLKTVLFNV